LSHRARQMIESKRARIRALSVEMIHHRPERGLDVATGLAVDDAERQVGGSGNLPGEIGFVVALLGKARREQWRLQSETSQGQRNQRTVDTAALQDGERNVADHLAPDDALDRRLQKACGFIEIVYARCAHRAPELPLDPLFAGEADHAPGRHLFYSPKDCLPRTRMSGGEEGVQRRRIEPCIDLAARQYSLHLAREQHEVVVFAIIKRLDADAVARQDQAPRLSIPEADGKKALQ